MGKSVRVVESFFVKNFIQNFHLKFNKSKLIFTIHKNYFLYILTNECCLLLYADTSAMLHTQLLFINGISFKNGVFYRTA